MARVALDLEDPEHLAALSTTGWRVAMGLVPGEPNQGLVAELKESPARLVDYDDSGWAKDADFQDRMSSGLTFAWYRLRVTVPPQVKGDVVRPDICLVSTSGHRAATGQGRGHLRPKGLVRDQCG